MPLDTKKRRDQNAESLTDKRSRLDSHLVGARVRLLEEDDDKRLEEWRRNLAEMRRKVKN